MPIHYDVLEPYGLVISVLSGDLTDEEIIAHGRELNDDDRVRWPMRQLCDCRRVAGSPLLTSRGIRSTAHEKFRHPERHGGQVAVIIATAHAHGLARQFAGFAEPLGVEVQVFPNPDEALAWLGMSTHAGAILERLPEPLGS